MGTPQQALCLCSKGSPCRPVLYRSHRVPMAAIRAAHAPARGVPWPQLHSSHIPREPFCLHLPWKQGSHSSPCHSHPQLHVYQPALCIQEDTTVRLGSVMFIIYLVRLRIILKPFPEAVFLSHLSSKPPTTGCPDNPASLTPILTPTNSCWNAIQPLLNLFPAGSAMRPSHT